MQLSCHLFTLCSRKLWIIALILKLGGWIVSRCSNCSFSYFSPASEKNGSPNSSSSPNTQAPGEANTRLTPPPPQSAPTSPSSPPSVTTTSRLHPEGCAAPQSRGPHPGGAIVTPTTSPLTPAPGSPPSATQPAMGGIGGEGATAYGEEGDLGEGAQTVVVSLLKKKMKFELKFELKPLFSIPSLLTNLVMSVSRYWVPMNHKRFCLNLHSFLPQFTFFFASIYILFCLNLHSFLPQFTFFFASIYILFCLNLHCFLQCCNVCQKQFANVHRLQRHMISHNESEVLRRFKCDECGKAFKFKHHLKVRNPL